ncbi:MAG: twin-arginine translocase TatA/TatE family subunit [Abitibacteriaceae bacterium]|nr:twin-arginine translocase TatA/TatE family subunit [Abditibacteriaceae bacterium]
MLGLGTTEIVVLLLLVLILFGGKKIPEMMQGLGQGMREFKKATRDDDDRPTQV